MLCGDRRGELGVPPVEVLERGAVVPGRRGALMPRALDEQGGPAEGLHDGDVGSEVDAVVVLELLEGEAEAAGDGGLLLARLVRLVHPVMSMACGWYCCWSCCWIDKLLDGALVGGSGAAIWSNSGRCCWWGGGSWALPPWN